MEHIWNIFFHEDVLERFPLTGRIGSRLQCKLGSFRLMSYQHLWYMGVSTNGGYTLKWMVYVEKQSINMDDLYSYIIFKSLSAIERQFGD